MPRGPNPLPLLGGLYTVQGVVFGFTTGVLIPLLAQRGVSLEDQTGVLALASFPWVFKLPIALALDRLRPGAAKAAGLSMVVLGIGLAGLGGLGDALPTFSGLGAAWLGINVLLAAQDISADVLAIDAVAPEHRGRANGVMWAGLTVGQTLLGTLGLGAVLHRLGLGAALVLLAAFVALGGMWSMRSSIATVLSASREGVVEVLRTPSTWLLGGLASVFIVADVGTSALSGALWIQRLHWPMERITTTLPLVVLFALVLGYAVAALVVDRIGHARAAASGSVALGASWALFAALEPLWSAVPFLYGFVIVQAIPTALLYVGLYAWLMDRVLPRFRATHYAVFMSLLNLPRVWAPTLAPDALEALGWPALFAVAGALQATLGGLAWWVARGTARARGTATARGTARDRRAAG